MENVSEEEQDKYRVLHDKVCAVLHDEPDANLRMSVLLNLAVLSARNHKWEWSRFISEVYGLWREMGAALKAAEAETPKPEHDA
jgi:hypothetical protein